jgi:hypothetical protein
MAIQAVIEQYQLGKESCILFFDDDPAYLSGAIEYFNRVNLTQVLVAGSVRPPLSKTPQRPLYIHHPYKHANIQAAATPGGP